MWSQNIFPVEETRLKKEVLQARLAKIEHQLAGFSQESDTTKREVRKRGPRRRRSLKEGITKALQAAGKEGLAIKDLAAKLKAKPASVSVWFYTTGKKIKAIKKVGTARFAYIG